MPMRCRSTAVGAFSPRALQLPRKKAAHRTHYMGMWPITKAILLAIGCATSARSLSADKRPIIVGGTGLYFRALTEGLADIPPIPANIRAQSAGLLSQGGLQPMLEDLDDCNALAD